MSAATLLSRKRFISLYHVRIDQRSIVDLPFAKVTLINNRTTSRWDIVSSRVKVDVTLK